MFFVDNSVLLLAAVRLFSQSLSIVLRYVDLLQNAIFSSRGPGVFGGHALFWSDFLVSGSIVSSMSRCCSVYVVQG